MDQPERASDTDDEYEDEPIFAADADSTESGFRLKIETDEENYSFLIQDTVTARILLAATNKLRPWIDERDRAAGVERHYETDPPQQRGTDQ